MMSESICWLLESSGLAGGVKVALEYAARLAQLGHPTTILSLEKKPDWFALGTRVKWLNYPTYEAIIQVARSTGYDAVVATWWKTAYVARDIMDGSPAT